MAEKSGVNTEVHENHNNNNNNNVLPDRPPSATSRANREERLKLLKEKQNEERLRKLEELKQHALQSARLREEQDFRRRKHFEEFGKKEEERRKQAEERRRQLEEDRKLSLQTKWETKKNTLANHRNGDKKPVYAFGSCTPRLVDTVDGCLWKSQYNLHNSSSVNSGSKDSGHGTTKSTSAHDLHSQIKMSQSMYEWNQQRSTFTTAPTNDKSLKAARRRSMIYNNTTKQMEPDRVFCGRRKTDLTPTIPIRRSEEGGQNSSSRSASRASGFSKSHSGQGTPRPPSSMSSSMISSTHSTLGSVTSGVQMRPRSLASKKSRPASVHVTGISSSGNTENQIQPKSQQSQRPATAKKIGAISPIPPPSAPKPLKSKAPAPPTAPTESKKSGEAKKSALTPPAPIDTNTIKRAAKKNQAPKPPVAPVVPVVATEEIQPLESSETSVPEVSTPAQKSEDPGLTVASEPSQGAPDMLDFEVPSFLDAGQSLVVVQSEQKSMQIPQSTNPFDVFMATPPAVAPAEAEVEEVLAGSGNSNPFAGVDFLIGNNNEAAAPAMEVAIASSEESGAKPKVLTEEEAKAALAEKRRLAREAQEREAARLEEEERLEEERQRLEAEEAERLVIVARQMEEERLRVAIEEQRKREEEEKKRREEEEVLRLEREREEREAAREAERIRQEMEERLKREEEERLERKRRVEAIMSRTRKSGTDSAKATTPVPEEIPSPNPESSTESPLPNYKANNTNHPNSNSVPLNGLMLLDPLGVESGTTNTITNLNNYNNNHHSPQNSNSNTNANFSTLIDFGDSSSPSPSPVPPPTAIGSGVTITTNGTATTPTTTTTTQDIHLINHGLQDLLS